jgi:Icc protein
MPEKNTRADFVIAAHITDLHLRTDHGLYNGTHDTSQPIAACIDHLRSMQPQPDFILASGDLADEPRVSDYTELRRVLDQLDVPVYVIPGNHDDRDMLRDAFADLGYLPTEGKYLNYTIEDYPLRVIGLDNTGDDPHRGEFCASRLAWLDDRLSEQPDRPTILFMHFQPLLTRMGYRDRNAMDGANEMDAVLRRHPQVELIACGHLHRSIQMRWGGTLVSVAPSAVVQRTLSLDNSLPQAYVDEPPGMAVYVWHPDTGPICHTSLIGDFGAPYPLELD